MFPAVWATSGPACGGTVTRQMSKRCRHNLEPRFVASHLLLISMETAAVTMASASKQVGKPTGSLYSRKHTRRQYNYGLIKLSLSSALARVDHATAVQRIGYPYFGARFCGPNGGLGRICNAHRLVENITARRGPPVPECVTADESELQAGNRERHQQNEQL